MGTLLEWMGSLKLWQLGLLLIALFWFSAWIGRLLHKRRPTSDEKDDAGFIVSSSLGLLALLLGFTVSMAVGRYEGRRAATLEEANAIGTFLYRTDLMPAEARAATQAKLETYVAARIAAGRMGESADDLQESARITSQAQAAMWRQVLAVRAAVPDPAMQILVVESANHMFDMATARDTALGNRLPPTLILLLIFFPVASLILIGYVSGESIGVHLMASSELILLLTLVLLLIADLNQPRSGTIVTPMTPLLGVQAQLAAVRAAPAPAATQPPAPAPTEPVVSAAPAE